MKDMEKQQMNSVLAMAWSGLNCAVVAEFSLTLWYI